MTAAKRIFLIHWNDSELSKLAAPLRAAGFEVFTEGSDGGRAGGAIRAEQPDAVVIYLRRLPSHGRVTAAVLRETKSTRALPIVFVDGEPEKLEKVRRTVPHAAFVAHEKLIATLKRLPTSARPPKDWKPARAGSPDSRGAGYSGTPLPRKLGLEPGMRACFVDPPAGYVGRTLALPDGVDLVAAPRAPLRFAQLFVTRRKELESGVRKLGAALAERGMLWVSWPKKTSGVASEVSEGSVREVALANGLVDVKVCAVDEVWSGLKLVRRKAS